MKSKQIAVLITSFNRRESTLKSLTTLFQQRQLDGAHLSVILVDDGSTDGTQAAVMANFPEVRVLHGDGTLFWNGGMRMAFGAALPEQYDHYLLLNDDVALYDYALERLINSAHQWSARGTHAIVVGSTLSTDTGELSYGGFARHVNGIAISLKRVKPHIAEPVACDTMNGNCVLIPKEIAETVGNIEPHFRHQFGDLDYGLRARRAGFDVIVAPGYIGECSANSRAGTWRDPSISFTKRWKSLMSPKGVPVREWLLFTRRHYGWRWIYYAPSPYLKTIMSSLFARKHPANLNPIALRKH
jgi:GT2 family glycosyltransferase